MMKFPRLSAAITVIVLIGVIALIIIGVLNATGPLLVHGSSITDTVDGTMHMVEHESGTILRQKSDHSFVLVTATGQQKLFQCKQRCLLQLGHIQRHINEHARTDIYYIHMDTILEAIDVD
ncbi:hypothetical protein [Tengunoibacter tsumagoiensis]|uniref:Uncharacterized protein n=1 Tax=Tengunoibacter tsumagoiensis TaxID=2014871 RepID=A0A401ZV59_9CHLR|nr:hypothetical protein [Tengunoibacter tsumagoiensis]GCE10620.1 hypothetical protein KTT_04790 [Tengunoibacter tsumagoiensis]